MAEIPPIGSTTTRVARGRFEDPTQPQLAVQVFHGELRPQEAFGESNGIPVDDVDRAEVEQAPEPWRPPPDGSDRHLEHQQREHRGEPVGVADRR